MARKRIEQRIDLGDGEKKQWGVQNGTVATRRRPDGSTYLEFRWPYYASVPVERDGVIEGHVRKRLWASSTVTMDDAERKADKRAKEYLEAEEAHWKRFQIAQGILPPEPAPRAPKVRKRLDLIACAEELMNLRMRYVDGELTGAKFGYRKKVAGYNTLLACSGLSDDPMDCLTLAQVTEWFVRRYLPSRQETTAARFKAWLVQVGDWGVGNGYWEENLFQRLPVLCAKAKNKEERDYTLEEIDAMWRAARTPQERALLVLLRCGLRQGECTALAEDQIVDDQTIFVKYTLGYEDNRWEDRSALGKVPKTVPFLHRPKGASAGRVHIPKPWMAHVREALKVARPDLVRAYDDGSASESGDPAYRRFVCSNRYGLCWGDTCVSEALRRLMERAGVKVGNANQTFHAWRHSLASDLLAFGNCGDMELAYLMRHKDYNMSKNVYANSRQKHLAAYRQYSSKADSPKDFIDALCAFDEDRRSSAESTER